MKTLIILFLAFAGLGAFVYFYEIAGEEKREAQQELETKLLPVEEEAISGVEIERAGELPIVLEKKQGEWSITSPVQSSVDPLTGEGLVRDLTSAGKDKELDVTGDALEQYGLSNPRVTLTVKTPDQQHVLKIGGEDYTGNRVYVRMDGQDKVFLTAKRLFSSSDKGLTEWRSRKILDFRQDDVEGIELLMHDKTIRLSKQSGDWRLEQPVQDKADSNTVSSLLSSLQYGRIEKFVNEQPEKLAEYDLEHPAVKVRLKESGSEDWKVLEIGGAQNGFYFARNPARRPVFTIKDSVLEKLAQDIWAYRDKSVVTIKQDQVNRFVISSPEREIAIEKSGEEWVIQSPDDFKGKKTQPYKFWFPVADIQFESLEAGATPLEPFKKPGATVEITSGEGKTHSYQFAEAAGSYWARDQETGRTGKISQSDFEKLAYTAESIVVE